MVTSEATRISMRSHVNRRVVARERGHRRATVVGLLTIFTLAVIPVVLDHRMVVLEDALSGFDHIGALCLASLHLLFAPVHGSLHLLLGTGLIYATWDRLRAWRKLRGSLALLDASVPREGSMMWNAVNAAGIEPDRVRVVRGLPNPAFTVGLMSPRIYVAAELSNSLSAEQLRMVIAHEAAHVQRRDPLRLSLLRTLGCMLFWIPVLAKLAEDLRDDSEILADDSAAGSGQSLVLASAIVALAGWRAPRFTLPSGAAGFCERTLLDRRVRRLLGEEVPVATHVTRGATRLAAIALVMAWISGLLMAHPLPAERATPGNHAHCAHDAESPLAHLFCRRAAHTRDCPHVAGAASIRHNH